MKVFIASVCVLLSAVAYTEAVRCDCSVGAKDDKSGNRQEAIIAFLGSQIADSKDCAQTSFNETQCYALCARLGREFIDTNGSCFPNEDPNSLECTGDIWCERIRASNPQGNSGGTFQLAGYAKLKNCDFGDEWFEVEQQDEYEKICCEADGTMAPNCGTQTCECNPKAKAQCECGLFSPLMFENKYRPSPNVDPIALASIGTDFGLEGDDWQKECAGFPTAPTEEKRDICSNYCIEQKEGLAGFTLNQTIPQSDYVTYGSAMCAGLYARVKQYQPFEELVLSVYGRAKNCNTTSGWQDSVDFGSVDEKLCCDKDGKWCNAA